jgi:hypothetical protein
MGTAMSGGRLMFWAALAILLAACGGEPPPPVAAATSAPPARPAPAQAWKIFYSIETETLQGDGISTGITATATTVGPQNVPDEIAAAIAALLPRLEGLAGTYRLSDDTFSAGTQVESITADFDGSSIDFRFEIGAGYPAPPGPVAELYELVARKPLPSAVEGD